MTIDHHRCQGHGRCHAVAPAVFELDELGQAVVVEGELDAAQIERARLAARNCPEHAISVSGSELP